MQDIHLFPAADKACCIMHIHYCSADLSGMLPGWKTLNMCVGWGGGQINQYEFSTYHQNLFFYSGHKSQRAPRWLWLPPQ